MSKRVKRKLTVMGNISNTKQTLRLDGGEDEPEYLFIYFPGGHLELSRCDDGSYWGHISTKGIGPSGVIVDARVDQEDKHAAETIELAGGIRQKGVYHVAVRMKGGA